MSQGLRVTTPTGDVVITRSIIKKCPLKIGEQDTVADLILVNMQKYEVILGMTWLTAVKAKIDCRLKMISFINNQGIRSMYEGDMLQDIGTRITTMEIEEKDREELR